MLLQIALAGSFQLLRMGIREGLNDQPIDAGITIVKKCANTGVWHLTCTLNLLTECGCDLELSKEKVLLVWQEVNYLV